MYFFYFDESGSRDPDVGTEERPKPHVYVLLAVGMYERQWRPFEQEISQRKLDLSDRLSSEGKCSFELADCEVKSTWLRNPAGRKNPSRFLGALGPDDLQDLTDSYLAQVTKRNAVILASVIDKRHLYDGTTAETLHKIAYEFLLERIQHYIHEYHPKHQALIVMDDTSIQLNRSVAMKHASFLRSGNWNMTFPNIVEYPFFARSELSNGVQLADQLAYNVYRAFRNEDMGYPYFKAVIPHFYKSQDGSVLHGLKIWPDASPLFNVARTAWETYKQKPPSGG